MSREMKDSGVEWIDTVPKDWDIVRLGSLLSERNEKVSDIDFAPLSVTKVGIVPQLENAAKSDNHNDRKKVCVGDFVINSRSDRKQSCGLSELEGSVSVINIVLKNKEIEPSYLRFLIDNYGFAEEFYRWGTGIVADLWSTRYERMKRLMLPLPPKFKQRRIGETIEFKMDLIDSIIEKTKSTIEDYKLLKQSIITEAVTKGLDKNVEMKVSRIDWVGEIPKHWKLSKLKYEFRIKKEIAGTDGYDLLSVTQNGLKVKDININEGQMAADYSKYQFVRENDYVMNHMDLLTGWVDYSIFNGVTSPDYRVFYMMNPEQNSPEYYKYIFQACYKNKVFYGMAQGVSNLGRWRLQADKFLNFYIPIPPKEEQFEIADYIVSEQKRYDEIISKKVLLLSELEVYKKSLIYEYVTGKKEVE